PSRARPPRARRGPAGGPWRAGGASRTAWWVMREQPTCHEGGVFRPAPRARVARSARARLRHRARASLSERAGEETVDRGPALLLEEARARAAEVRLGDDRAAGRGPRVPRPTEPADARRAEGEYRPGAELGH